ncbi:hypothetical protein GmHk_19G054598 [Glycine max]|nr:hypothetical protein GmHk_19G054598 [Glycine max]
MTHTKKSGHMTSEAAHQIANGIDFREEKSAQGNFVAHGRQDDPETDASNRHGLYVDDNPPRLVSHGRVYEWLTTVHHVPLGNDLVKVGVDRKFEMLMLASLYPLTRFNYWDRSLSPSLFDRHILYSLFQKRYFLFVDKHVPKGPMKPVDRLEPDNDPIYQMTLMIPQRFLKPMHMNKLSLGLANASIGHWQLVVICPKDNDPNNKPENYVKGMVNRPILIYNTFALSLVFDINILIVQYTCMFLLTSALKGFNNNHGSK